MNIQPTTSYNISMNGAPKGNSGGVKGFWHKLEQKILDTLPSKTIHDNKKNIKKWKNIDTLISKPAENRFIVGLTAIATQPAIDYYNHRVDEETRTVSRNRTIAKIAAGTIVGIGVRGAVYKLAAKMTNAGGKSKISKLLMPSSGRLYNYVTKSTKNLENYRNAVSTFAALLVMSITNFLIDAPLTVYFTNKLNAKSELLNKKHDNAANNYKKANLKEATYA